MRPDINQKNTAGVLPVELLSEDEAPTMQKTPGTATHEGSPPKRRKNRPKKWTRQAAKSRNGPQQTNPKTTPPVGQVPPARPNAARPNAARPNATPKTAAATNDLPACCQNPTSSTNYTTNPDRHRDNRNDAPTKDLMEQVLTAQFSCAPLGHKPPPPSPKKTPLHVRRAKAILQKAVYLALLQRFSFPNLTKSLSKIHLSTVIRFAWYYLYARIVLCGNFKFEACLTSHISRDIPKDPNTILLFWYILSPPQAGTDQDIFNRRGALLLQFFAENCKFKKGKFGQNWGLSGGRG